MPQSAAVTKVYVSLLVLGLGLSYAGITFYKVMHPVKPAEPTKALSSNINRLREQAMTEAQQKGQHTYSFTVDRAPLPISP